MNKYLIAFLFAVGALAAAENDVVLIQYDGSGVPLERTLTADNAITSLATFRQGFGLEIGVDVQAYDADLTTWAGITPGSGVGTFIATPSFSNLNAALTGDDAAGLAAANTFTGVNTFSGSIIRTPATITISEGSPDTGTIDITKGYSVATIDEATTLSPSAAGTSGQYVILDIVNAGASAYVVTVDTASDFTLTAAASSTTPALIRSDGSGWLLVGGSPSVVDLSTAPAGVIYQQQVVNSSTGTSYKIAAGAARLGSHTTPDTTAGAITWAAEVYEVFANTTTEYDLPAAAGYDGKALLIYNTGSNIITIDPNGSEVIVRDGTVQTGGVTMTLSAGAGNYVALICDGVRWVTLGYKGTLAAGS